MAAAANWFEQKNKNSYNLVSFKDIQPKFSAAAAESHPHYILWALTDWHKIFVKNFGMQEADEMHSFQEYQFILIISFKQLKIKDALLPVENSWIRCLTAEPPPKFQKCKTQWVVFQLFLQLTRSRPG